ncbi:MAG: hypothetical protein ACLR6J_04950 [Parabacteroides merdae]
MQLFEDQKEKERCIGPRSISSSISLMRSVRRLTLIKNPLERLLKSDKIGEKENKSLTLMDKIYPPSLVGLVNHLLDFRKTGDRRIPPSVSSERRSSRS